MTSLDLRFGSKLWYKVCTVFFCYCLIKKEQVRKQQYEKHSHGANYQLIIIVTSADCSCDHFWVTTLLHSLIWSNVSEISKENAKCIYIYQIKFITFLVQMGLWETCVYSLSLSLFFFLSLFFPTPPPLSLWQPFVTHPINSFNFEFSQTFAKC